MISYAQNLEDVMLERALKGRTQGFYIDVGAWEPVIDSVTKHFYDKGWRGINVEPFSAYYAKLLEARPEDVNLKLGLLDRPGRAPLYAIGKTGLSTLQKKQADSHRNAGLTAVEEVIEISTLAAICELHVKDRPIDFLKIDTEGTELQVLQGGDWKRFRPRIVLVEATRPNSQELCCLEADALLRENRYRFAYFDGLNRFYVAEEEARLAARFTVPPNVFDEFVTYRTLTAEDRAFDLEARMKVLKEKAARYDYFIGSAAGRLIRRMKLI